VSLQSYDDCIYPRALDASSVSIQWHQGGCHLVRLSTLVMVGFNKKAFKPQLDAIKDKYYEMFHNKSGKETVNPLLGFRV